MRKHRENWSKEGWCGQKETFESNHVCQPVLPTDKEWACEQLLCQMIKGPYAVYKAQV
jgi:hypothetical protein